MSALPFPSGGPAGFLAILPAVRKYARFPFRSFRAERRLEAVQETLASAWAAYQALANKGRLHDAHPGTLASFAARFVRAGRPIGGSQDRATDVLSSVAQRRHGFRTVDLMIRDTESGGWRQMAIADRRHPIPDTAAFRIDFARWLRTLSGRDRKIIDLLLGGAGTSEVAGRAGISHGRASQLRQRYERAWRAFQGETVESPAA